MSKMNDIIKSIEKLEKELAKLKTSVKTSTTSVSKAKKKSIAKCSDKKELEQFTVQELSEFAQKNGIKVKKSKKELTKAIWEYLDESDSDSDSEYSDSDSESDSD